MSFRINTNVSAMNAHTSSLMNNRNLSNSLAKLSSGLRINKAADDASGLAIANSLRAQASSLGQAISNGNDAVGLIQTADGALSEYSNILDTIKTKAVQAASDGQNTNSRLAIQKDIDRLMEQLDTIAKTTSFNGQKLLSGTFTNKEFQMGASSNESAKVSIASTETSQIGQTSRAVLNAGSDQGGSIQLTLKSALTGKDMTLKAVDIQYNNNAQNGMGALADEINRYSGDTGIKAKAVVETTSNDAVSAGVTGSDFAINGVLIGAINVADNDNDGTLANAINSKTVQTGVAATMTADGKISLSTADGRAIKVDGDISGVFGSSAKEMSGLGHIELVQAGSSTFEIQGIGAGAVGANIVTTGTTTMLKDSILAAGSTIASDSVLKIGTTLGGDVTLSTAAGGTTLTLDSFVKAGSVFASGSTIKEGTTLGGTLLVSAGTAATLNRDSFVTAGTVLGTGTILGEGTVLQQDFSIGTDNYKKGDVVVGTLTLTNGLTLSSDMTLKHNSTSNTTIEGGTTFNAGSILGADFSLHADNSMTVAQDMTLKGGSVIGTSGTAKLVAGSVIGGDITARGAVTTYAKTELAVGSTLATDSTVAKNSTIGGQLTVNNTTNLEDDMMIKAGSTLTADTRIKAGTVLTQDIGNAVHAGTNDFKAGDVLTSDLVLTGSITLQEDMKLLKGSGTAGAIGDGSILMPNTTNSGSVGLDNEEFTNLSNIDVTTLEGAMKAIDTLDAAITNLDTIRSDLGSVQNQVVSTINNISVTQVNVKAAESNIRDVDFAAESAAFSKFNILAQSGSYAMSQANAVQQNVLRLLQ